MQRQVQTRAAAAKTSYLQETRWKINWSRLRFVFSTVLLGFWDAKEQEREKT